MAQPGIISRTAAEIRRDVATARSRDPAARGVRTVEIAATWPGVHALLAHRVAHALHGSRVPWLPRLIAFLTRAVTGIEIHPAAKIGERFFIDHGMGVVIGETAEIGDDVTLYQGVTLGGTGFSAGKRHPTVQDNVTIGAGANLLGPIVVGHGSKIGAGSVVIHDVPPNSTVVGNPGHPVRVAGRRPEGPDTDWVHLPDPIADAIKELAGRITILERALVERAVPPASPPLDGDEEGLPSRPPTDDAPSPSTEDATSPSADDVGARSVGPNPAGG